MKRSLNSQGQIKQKQVKQDELCQSQLTAQEDTYTLSSTSVGVESVTFAAKRPIEKNDSWIKAVVDSTGIEPYYNLDGIVIWNCDCRSILEHLPKVDLLLTDPPYGIDENDRKIASRGKMATPRDYGVVDWDKAPIEQTVIDQVIAQAKKAIIWGGNYYTVPPTPSWLVWDKRNGSNDFADCELAWSNLGCAVRKIEHLWHGMLRQDNEQRFHPTQKPLKVITWAMSLAKDAQTILDPFMGSGTTLVAAKNLGKKAIGIEISEEYCRIAVERLAQKNLFGQTGDSQ